MSDWAARKFWSEVTVGAGADGGYEIHLDHRVLRSPAKAPLRLPSRALADAISEEWHAQTEVIDPSSMPLTRAANSAIDKVAPQREAVIDMLAAYGGTDLLCYRAEGPAGLIARQAAHWGPVLDWLKQRFDADLKVTTGVVPVAQPPEALARLRAQIARYDDFALTGFHDLVTISGSLAVALAVAEGHLSVDDGWACAAIDEAFQAENWGWDDEAVAHHAQKQAAFNSGLRFMRLSAQ